MVESLDEPAKGGRVPLPPLSHGEDPLRAEDGTQSLGLRLGQEEDETCAFVVDVGDLTSDPHNVQS